MALGRRGSSRWALRALGGVLLFTAPGQAQVTAVSGFLHVSGTSGAAGCLPASLANEALLDQVEDNLTAVSLDPDFVVVLTSAVLTCPDIFYVPVANDVSGIGYQHEGLELYDQNPETALEGILFLNDLPYWLEEPEELRTAFLHELGHRWLARVHARTESGDLDLTGRQGGHWSYFLETGGSPLEGNRFATGQTAVAETELFPTAYSELDLYLMGAVSPDEVAPFRYLEWEETSDVVDCVGEPLGAESPPQACGPVELAGTFRTLTVEDVIDFEGPREPAAAEAPREFSVAFLLLDADGAEMDQEQCSELSGLTGELISLFGAATGGRMKLGNAVSAGESCAAFLESQPPASASCQTARPAPGRSLAGRWVAGVLLLGAVVERARRSRRPGVGSGSGEGRVARGRVAGGRAAS